MQKSRITNLSTRFLVLYKNGVLIILLSFLGFMLYRVIQEPSVVLISVMWCWLIWRYFEINRKVYHVEFDDEYLYLIRKDADVLIPLQNIENVELKTMGGLYAIKLYHPEVVGDLIYYKPSLLYPFNFKSKDAVANVLRSKIEEAKRKPVDYHPNTLMS